jgi:hypothetical protein
MVVETRAQADLLQVGLMALLKIKTPEESDAHPVFVALRSIDVTTRELLFFSEKTHWQGRH